MAGKDKADKNKRDEQKPVFLCIGVYDDPLIAGSDLEIVPRALRWRGHRHL